MYKKTVEVEDFEGNKFTEDLYFNFTKTELTKLNLENRGGMTAVANQIVNEKDGKKLYEIFEMLILGSYGKKVETEHGTVFLKKPEWTELFKASTAFDKLFIEFYTNPREFAEFFNAIIPSDTKLSAADLDQVVADAEKKAGLTAVLNTEN